jgi:urease subunit alpha
VTKWADEASTRLARHGPTLGDRIRLGDTDLWITVGEDRQAPGDEPMWGYARNLRPGLAQAPRVADSQLDVLIAGAVVVDPSMGLVKADIGIKDGRIAGIGRAGNPQISDGIDLEVGPLTQTYMGYGYLVTPGAIDSHVHTISPELIPAALSGGVTTLISAGFQEPPWAMERTLAALEGWPVNVGLQANARAAEDAPLEALIEAGAVGFKIHEDYGAYPEIIDHTLRFADEHDVSVSLHTDGLNESAELDDTVAAIAGRTVHAYHVEGAGGGHVPDLIGLVREPHVICSSTTPTIPYGVAAPAEHVPMTVLNHGVSFGVPADLELVRERIRPTTMAAEGPLHELGAIGIVNSDSQGMGRIGETVRRTVQLAHVMKAWRATEAGSGHPGLPDDGADDTARVLRYLAKVTIEPALTHGIADVVGSLLPGRLADLVLWKPAFFGAKPEWIFKAGYPAWGSIGEGNATVERSEPTRYLADWGALATVAPRVAVTFVSGAVDRTALARRFGTARSLLPVRGCRGLTRDSLALNRATAPVEVDRLTGEVSLGGRLPDVADGEAVGERVGRVDDVRREAGDPGRSGERGHDRGIWADRRLLYKPAGEDRAQDALVAEVLVQPEPALRMEDRHSGARAGAARRTVDRTGPRRRFVPVQLAGRHRHDVPHRVGRIVGRPRQLADRDPAEARLIRMADRQLFGRRGLDHLGDPDDIAALVRGQP